MWQLRKRPTWSNKIRKIYPKHPKLEVLKFMEIRHCIWKFSKGPKNWPRLGEEKSKSRYWCLAIFYDWTLVYANWKPTDNCNRFLGLFLIRFSIIYCWMLGNESPKIKEVSQKTNQRLPSTVSHLLLRCELPVLVDGGGVASCQLPVASCRLQVACCWLLVGRWTLGIRGRAVWAVISMANTWKLNHFA